MLLSRVQELENGTVTSAASTAATALPISESKKAMNIRQWILSEIPGIEASTLHVLAKQLEKVGVNTYGDLVECIRKEVVDVADVKGYVDITGITRIKAVNLLMDVKAIAASKPA